ncbi:MAG TPA: hypothetical protein VF155_08955 [Candidatus Dormibacteraeota bacterium]
MAITLVFFAFIALCILAALFAGTSPKRAIFGGGLVATWFACNVFSGFELLFPAAFLRWRERCMEGAPDYSKRLAGFTDRYVFGKDAYDERIALGRVRRNGFVLLVVLSLECALLWLIFVWVGLL